MSTGTSAGDLKGGVGPIANPGQIQRLHRFIRDRLGIHLPDHQLDLLRETVVKAREKFGYEHVDAYLVALDGKADTSAELEHLIAGITTGETYFFRDDAQMKFLREQWLPKVMTSRKHIGRTKQLRIWSAGCASGEELYSIAILLYEALADPEAWNIRLLGTDINVELLARAVAGRYRPWSLRSTPDHLRSKYFSATEQGHVLKPEVRANVSFCYLNLVADRFPSILTGTNALDLILCRNVFIYFAQDVVQRVLAQFVDCLNPEGILLVGPSDVIHREVPGLRYRQVEDTGYYERHGGRTEAVSAKRPRTPPLHEPDRAGNRPPQDTTPLSSIQPDRSMERSRAGDNVTCGNGSATVPDARLIGDLLGKQRWQEALNALDSLIEERGASAQLYQWQAKALANIGQLEVASERCRCSLELDRSDKHTHFLHAMVLAALGRGSEAIASLRRSLYLDHAFIEAHFHLGLLRLHAGRWQAGLKSLKNALRFAERNDPAADIHDAPGLTVGRLTEILRQEISLYEGREPRSASMTEPDETTEMETARNTGPRVNGAPMDKHDALTRDHRRQPTTAGPGEAERAAPTAEHRGHDRSVACSGDAAARLMPQSENDRRVLVERAAKLARAVEARGGQPVDQVPFVCFRLGSSARYGIAYRYITAVIPFDRVTRVPCTPAVFAGVVNHRSRLLPLLDLRQIFSTEDGAPNTAERIIVVSTAGLTVGILANAIEGDYLYAQTKLGPPPLSEGSDSGNYIEGIHEGTVTILDVQSLLESPALRVHEHPSQTDGWPDKPREQDHA